MALFNWKNDDEGDTALSASNLNNAQQMVLDEASKRASDDNNNLYKQLINIIYPVGSVIMNVNSTNPGEYIRGTIWEQYAQGKTIVGVDSGDSDFGAVEKTGGEKTHKHLYGFRFGAYYGSVGLEQSNQVGILKDGNGETQPWGLDGTVTGMINGNATDSNKTTNMSAYKAIATTSSASSLQPYITTYIWKRTK